MWALANRHLHRSQQVTIYRLITAGTIDERILQLARSKQLVQNAVVGSSTTTVDTGAKPAEVMSLLLDDDEMRDTVKKQQAKRQMVGELKSEGARKGLARREENRRVKELQGTPGASTPFGADSQDEDDAFAFFVRDVVVSYVHHRANAHATALSCTERWPV